jgi:ribosome-associated toxin RatA of RatAB toxin-antitoxin module
MFRTNTLEAVATAGGRSGARRPFVTAAVILGAAAAISASAAPEPNITVREESGIYNVAATFTVPQARSFVMAALTDYDQIPRFMPEVRISTVLERREDGAVVEQEAVARFMMFSKRVHLVLDVQQERGAIRFRDRCGKSFARYEGVWTIGERGAATHITYELAAKPAFQVPEFLLKRLLKRDAIQMIERLQVEIATRSRQPNE